MKKITIRILKIHNVSDRLALLCKKADFCTEIERNKILITASELLDNLITHGEIGLLGVIITLREQKHVIVCSIYVESHHTFAQFAERMEACKDNPQAHKPWYDHNEHRWHGLGLRMCENLADKIRYRPGKKLDRIFFELLRDK